MTRHHLFVFAAGVVVGGLLARYGIAATVGLFALGCPLAAAAAGLADAWRTRRTEWADIDARHATTRILDQGGR